MRTILKRITALLAAAALMIPVLPACAEEMQPAGEIMQTAEKQSVYRILYHPGAYATILSEVFDGVLGESETLPETITEKEKELYNKLKELVYI